MALQAEYFRLIQSQKRMKLMELMEQTSRVMQTIGAKLKVLDGGKGRAIEWGICKGEGQPPPPPLFFSKSSKSGNSLQFPTKKTAR